MCNYFSTRGCKFLSNNLEIVFLIKQETHELLIQWKKKLRNQIDQRDIWILFNWPDKTESPLKVRPGCWLTSCTIHDPIFFSLSEKECFLNILFGAWLQVLAWRQPSLRRPWWDPRSRLLPQNTPSRRHSLWLRWVVDPRKPHGSVFGWSIVSLQPLNTLVPPQLKP